jgi:hypothetical protein
VIGQWQHGGGFSVDVSVRIAAAGRGDCRCACARSMPVRTPADLGELRVEPGLAQVLVDKRLGCRRAAGEPERRRRNKVTSPGTAPTATFLSFLLDPASAVIVLCTPSKRCVRPSRQRQHAASCALARASVAPREDATETKVANTSKTTHS